MARSIEEALEEERLLLEAMGRGEYCCLRHSLPYIRVSMLVGQLVCERRLDYELREGVREARSRDIIKLLKPFISGSESLKRCRGRRVLASIPIAALVEGIPVIGRPDAIVFEDCVATGIVRVKEADRASRLDEARLRLYGLLLDYSPLPSRSDVRLVQLCSRDRSVLAESLIRLRLEGLASLRQIDVKIYTWVYDRYDALTLFQKLTPYWLMLRDPVPRPGWACETCRWRGVCDAGSV